MGHQPLVWYGMQLPLNFPFSLQAVWLCLLGISQDPHYYYLWFWIQILHHAGKTKQCHNVESWLFLGYWARWTCACTTLYHSSTLLLPCLKLVRRPNRHTLHFFVVYRTSHIFPRLYLDWAHLQSSPRHILVHAKIPTPGNHFLELLLFR